MAEVVEIKQENLVFGKPKLITDNVMHYCPGCSHGTVSYTHLTLPTKRIV